MARKPISIEVEGEGDARYVVLSYANGEVERRPVRSGEKPRRRPRRPQTRIRAVRPRPDDETDR